MTTIVESPQLISGIVTLILSALVLFFYIRHSNYIGSEFHTVMLMIFFLVVSIILIIDYFIKYPSFITSPDIVPLIIVDISVIIDSFVVTRLLCDQ